MSPRVSQEREGATKVPKIRTDNGNTIGELFNVLACREQAIEVVKIGQGTREYDEQVSR